MKTKIITAALISLACTIGMNSCSEDSPRQPLASTQVTAEKVSYNSLSFSWQPVADAVEYGYRLSDENGIAVSTGVTQKTSMNFKGLQAATTYILEIWSFAAIDSDYTTPPAITLKATTDPIIKLATPVSLTSEEVDGAVMFTWAAVENATSYEYVVTGEDGTEYAAGNTDKTSVTIHGLETGDYIFSVYAATTVGGFENGDAKTIAFNIDVRELWRVEGSYYSKELDSSWQATMIAYSNSSYKILSFYGVEGYNLEFAVNEKNPDDMFTFIDGELYEYQGSKWWTIYTGIDYPDILWTYPWANYCYMDGDRNSGEVGIGLYYGENFDWGYDTFTWGGSSSDFNIDTLVGTYGTRCQGWESNSSTNWELAEFDYSGYSSTVAKVDDNTVSIDGFYWEECPVKGTVDASGTTITFKSQTYESYGDERYVFASADAFDAGVVATINADGSITIPDFGIWYEFSDGTTYNYVYGTAQLTKEVNTAKMMQSPGAAKPAKYSRKAKASKPPHSAIKPLSGNHRPARC